MSDHPLYERAREAISAVHGDTSVGRDKTREALEELASDIECALMALDEEDAADD